MSKLCIIGGIFATISLYSPSVFGNNVKGDVEARLISPSQMTAETLKLFCEKEPQVAYCDEVTEKVKKKKRKKNENAFYSYNVLSANYY